MALMLGSSTLLYDVADPLHPRAVCRITNTYARILTGTSFEYLVPRQDGTTAVMLHALGSNNEDVETVLQADLRSTNLGFFFSPVSMPPGSGVLAYLADGGTDANGFAVSDVWLATATGRTKIFSYSVGGIDAFGRPGIPPATLALSPDAQYLAAGWSITGNTVHVFRVSDHADVSPPMPQGLRFGFWAPSGHTLYLIGSSGVESWTPESGAAAVQGTSAWTLDPNFSPDATHVVFTALTASRDIRAYVYDLKTHATRLLIDQPRSSAVFVKAGWVWYLEEKPCVQTDNSACFDPTVPDGNVLAVNLATGQESGVSFQSGELPIQSGGFTFLASGDLWPRT
jgi:WD40 repeat protein